MSFDTNEALKHLKKTDPIMAALLADALRHATPVAIPKARTKAKYFEAIAGSIVSQQISVKAAESVWKKLKKGVGAITPSNLKDRTPDELREFGLSRQKAGYIIKSAAIWETLPIGKFSKMTNEEVIAELTKLHGIGRWTAEMFIMFTLARPDVFSMGDWGLMMAIKQQYKLDIGKKSHKKKIEKLTETWSPHRTLAALVLWHSKDAKPGV
jgi:DNA-3-methyladenine glycosylase II